MAILKPPTSSIVRPQLIALTPLNMFLERVKCVSEKLRADSAGLNYFPLQFGGIQGQQESLVSGSVVRIVDFKVTENE